MGASSPQEKVRRSKMKIYSIFIFHNNPNRVSILGIYWYIIEADYPGKNSEPLCYIQFGDGEIKSEFEFILI